MSFTPYGRTQLLRNMFMGGTGPTTVWFTLTSSVPGPADDASLLVEPTAAEYARQAYTVSGGFYESSAGDVSTVNGVVFPVPVVDWGVLRGWAMCTTATTGTGLVIVGGPLSQPRRASVGSKLRIGVDGIRLQLR